MLRTLIIVALAFGSLMATKSIASAQTVCGKRNDIVTQLHKKYGEERQYIGVQQGRGVVETYANTETGSWTILVTDPRGMSCLMAAGEAFEIVVKDKRTILGAFTLFFLLN